jgi:hypothetical protein
MSNTYLQDFGLLRKQARARDVHDPMSGAERWEDLQMDIQKPHIPQARRKPVRRNRTLTIDGVTAPCRKLSGKSSVALGFHTDKQYCHKLDTMKNPGYLAEMRMAGRPCQIKLFLDIKPRNPVKMSVNDHIRRLVRNIRFGKTPVESVRAVYRRKLSALWKMRHSL